MKTYILEGWIAGTLHIFPTWDIWYPVDFPIEVQADVEYECEDDNLITIHFTNRKSRAPETFRLRQFKYKIK